MQTSQSAFYGNEYHSIMLGDNAEVLKALLPEVEGMVDCIYIDPPYNNGELYCYYNDQKGYNDWARTLHKVLPLLYRCLSQKGSIWISIDDGEVHHLRAMCDEVFGAGSYLSTFIWEHRTTRENRAVFSNNHEYVLAYAKDRRVFKAARNKISHNGDFEKLYKNPDNDPRGFWQSISANVQAGHGVPSQFYTIISPITGRNHNPPKGRCWVYSEKRMLKEIAENNIWFGRDGNGVPRIKKFLSPESFQVVPQTLWRAEEVGTTNSAKKQIQNLLPDLDGFDTPKPEGLLKRVLEIATNPGELVLDAFLGSGTTAAVAHKMSRNYIGIDNNHVCIDYAKKRLEKVLSGEQSGISKEVEWRGGGTFSEYVLVNTDPVLIRVESATEITANATLLVRP
jgi:adenine-specific DNA-methyltransferase